MQGIFLKFKKQANLIFDQKKAISPIRIRTIFIIILFLLLFFIPCYDYWFDGVLKIFFNHIDEAFIIFAYIYCLINVKKLYKKKKVILIYVIFWMIGFISSVIYRYQPLFPTIVDGFLIINKFFIGYLFMYIYIIKHRNVDLLKIIEKPTKMLIVILFVLLIHDFLFSPFFEKGEYRYFMNSFQLMFPHPTYLAISSVILLLISKNFSNKTNKYMIISSLLCISTLRLKAIGFIAFFWIFYISTGIKTRINKRKIRTILFVSLIVAFIIGFSQIKDYFFNENKYSPRLIMTLDSLRIAINHFPFGSGFGTYGSTIASQYYSPLYVTFGYQNNYGMSESYSAFLTDDCWQMILAQFGFFGLLISLFLIVKAIKKSLFIYKKNRNKGIVMISCLAYLLIVSIAETSFFNPCGLLMAFIFSYSENREEMNNEKNVVYNA